jgi:hypothetical protein
MNHVKQQSRYGCGHACLAMLLGLSYKDAVALVGRERKRGTTAPDLIPHLRAAGYNCPDRLILGFPDPPPDLALVRVPILKVGGRITKSHWMVYRSPFFYDPSMVVGIIPRQHMKRRITSHLPISDSKVVRFKDVEPAVA